MTTTASIAELQSAGLTLEAGEAVAIAQQLIQSLRGASAPVGLEPPYGPPTAATVILNPDGTVSCPGCGSRPAISEIAIFLDTMLPAGSPRVPGGVRYTIARALLEVDVAPFDSLDAFSASLARHERGDRAEVIKRLLKRSESACAAAAVAQAERRRRQTNVSDLRRALREADARLYVQQHSSRAAQPSQPSAVRTVPAIAACVGAGLMLIAAGEFMQRGAPPKPMVTPVAAPAPDPVHATGRALAPGADEANVNPNVAAPVATLGSTDTRATSPSIESAPSAERVPPRSRERAQASRSARPAAIKKTSAERSSVLDRLKLQWLKKKFAIRVDAL
jgi:hypothetical protein